MSFFRKFLLWFLLPISGLFAAGDKVSPSEPIVNFRLWNFNPEGFRAWLVRGSEARRIAADQLDVKELTLTVFTGKKDEKMETLILSPSARVQPTESLVSGKSTIRVINDQFEASGIDWVFKQKEKEVSIARNVRVTFRAEFKDVLK